MKRIMLRVAYDGTGYHGYQAQNNAITVEGELNKAIQELTKEVNIELIGGSRTDAGVHALDNVLVFDTESSVPGDKFGYALNRILPDDIRVVYSGEVALDFHPRHCDTIKTYEYHILNAKYQDPVKRHFSTHVYVPLNIEKMKVAAKQMEGEHDFTSFCTVGAQCDSKVRTIYSVEILTFEGRNEVEVNMTDPKEKTTDIFVRVKGNGFLYNMVRIIVGTLIEVGRGNMDENSIANIIEQGDRAKAGPTAKPEGLTLISYDFV